MILIFSQHGNRGKSNKVICLPKCPGYKWPRFLSSMHKSMFSLGFSFTQALSWPQVVRRFDRKSNNKVIFLLWLNRFNRCNELSFNCLPLSAFVVKQQCLKNVLISEPACIKCLNLQIPFMISSQLGPLLC